MTNVPTSKTTDNPNPQPDTAALRKRLAKLEADLWTAKAALADVSKLQRLGIFDGDASASNAGKRALRRAIREADMIGRALGVEPTVISLQEGRGE